MLDWLGDVGGLIDAISYLLTFCLGPFLAHAYESFILAKFFRREPKKKQKMRQCLDDENGAKSKFQAIKSVISTPGRINSMKFLPYFTLRLCNKKRKKFHAELKRSQQKLDRELDLHRFVSRQRMHSIAIMSLLSVRQHLLVSKLSKLLLKHPEASDLTFKSTSSGDSQRSVSGDHEDAQGHNTLLSVQAQHASIVATKLAQSRDPVDKRLVQLIQLRDKQVSQNKRKPRRLLRRS